MFLSCLKLPVSNGLVGLTVFNVESLDFFQIGLYGVVMKQNK